MRRPYALRPVARGASRESGAPGKESVRCHARHGGNEAGEGRSMRSLPGERCDKPEARRQSRRFPHNRVSRPWLTRRRFPPRKRPWASRCHCGRSGSPPPVEEAQQGVSSSTFSFWENSGLAAERNSRRILEGRRESLLRQFCAFASWPGCFSSFHHFAVAVPRQGAPSRNIVCARASASLLCGEK
ncbi:hypothetical protein HMPREF9946_01022 [Acetobacteraceae bacterium AT-5844]|nr:hypothetical protein HMPREF9946_01022 [Acetobacteraceae bacterium AT-5844]